MKRLLLLAALFLSGGALAQTAGVVTLTANPSSGTASVTPTLTWSTTPAAIGCVASGGWTGTKAGSGTQALTAVTANTDYTLVCSWSGGTGSKVVTWTAPTTNTDGSALTDLASFKVLWGGSATTLTNSKAVPGATTASNTVTGLANGTWFFTVRAVNASGVESDNGNIASAVVNVQPVTAAKTVTVTVTPKPNPPGAITVTDPVAYNVTPNLQRFVFQRGSRAGAVRIGAACDETRATVDGYNVISRNSQVTPRPAQGSVLVAKCG